MSRRTVTSALSFLVLLCAVILLCNNLFSQNYIQTVTGNYQEQFIIHEGILCEHKQTVRFKRDGRKIGKVKLGEPVVVAIAEEPYLWGYFQFPTIDRMGDGTLLISWQMKADSYKTYGQSNVGKNKMMSRDNGKTWIDYDGSYDIEKYSYSVFDGKEYMSFYAQNATDITKEADFPTPIDVIEDHGIKYAFFQESDLPEKLSGINLRKWKDRNAYASEMDYYHAKFNDEGLCRYATDNQYTPLWNGEVKQLNNGDVVGCTYRGFYRDENGKILPSGISFYKWNEDMVSWDHLGGIPFQPDRIIEPGSNERRVWGFSEPTFSELEDGTLVCVVRSSHEENLGPMYWSISKDGGRNWTKPLPFSPNGVKPHLLELGNETLVLTSGRPGVQLRFNFDKTGENWTEPMDMLPFMNEDGSYTRDVSCGYTGLLPINNNSFYMVYSDFLEHDKSGNVRKAIKIRKIIVNNYIRR